MRENYTRAVLPHTSVYDVHTFITYNYTCDDREIIAVKQLMAVQFLQKMNSPLCYRRRWEIVQHYDSKRVIVPGLLNLFPDWS